MIDWMTALLSCRLGASVYLFKFRFTITRNLRLPTLFQDLRPRPHRISYGPNRSSDLLIHDFSWSVLLLFLFLLILFWLLTRGWCLTFPSSGELLSFANSNVLLWSWCVIVDNCCFQMRELILLYRKLPLCWLPLIWFGSATTQLLDWGNCEESKFKFPLEASKSA